MIEREKSFWTHLKEYSVTTLGMVCYVLGWSVFLLPNNLISYTMLSGCRWDIRILSSISSCF